MSEVLDKQNKNIKLSKKQIWTCVLLVVIIALLIWLIVFMLRPFQAEDQKTIPCPRGSKCYLLIDNTSNSKKAESITTLPTSSSNTIVEPSVVSNSKKIITGLVCDQNIGVEYTIPEGWELRRKYKDLHIVSKSNTQVVQPLVTGESDLTFGMWIWKRKPAFGYGWSKNITLESLLNGSSHVNGIGQQLPFSNVNGLKGIILSGMSSDDANAKSVILTDGVSIISFTADGAGYPVLTDVNDITALAQIAYNAKFVQTCKTDTNILK